MTIEYLGSKRIQGLSSDTKPTNVPDNTEFTETNTGNIYKIVSGTWSLLNNATGGISASSTDTLTNKTIDSPTNTVKNIGPVSYEMWVDSTGPTYYARNISTGAITSNSNFRTLFNTVQSALSIGVGTLGGTIFIRKGTYIMDGEQLLGNATYVNNRLRVIGEGMDVTTIKRTGTDENTFSPYCNFEFENLTIDGNAIAFQLISCGQPVHGRCTNVKFARHTDIGLWYGVDIKSFITDKCVFEDPRGWQDQHAFTCTEYGIVRGCTFDRTTTVFTSASPDGSCLTSGGGDNILIENNRFVKANTFQFDGFGFSIEPWNRNYNNVIIANNVFINAVVRVGGGDISFWETAGVPETIMRNIVIDGNVVTGAEIGVLGPDTLWNTNGGKVRNVTISNNILNKPYSAGIRLYYLSGQINVNGNQIIDSNIGGNANTFGDQGCVWIYNCTDVSFNNNKIYMTATGTNVNPYGLAFNAVDGFTAIGNSFINTTINPSYVDAVDSTNTIVKDNYGIVDDVLHVQQRDLGGALIRMHGNDLDTFTLVNAEAGPSPNQGFHFFPDYTKQSGSTDVSFFYGYNSDISSYGFFSKWSGSLKEYFRVNPSQNRTFIFSPISIGDNFRLRLADTGLTANRDFTFPDVAGKVAVIGGPDIAQNPLNKRWGMVQPGYGTAVGTVGVMDGLCQSFTPTGAGSNTTSFDTTEGKVINYQTSNASGVVAGLLSPTAGGLGRRLFAGRMVCRFKLDSTTSARFYFGLTSATTLPISDTPLATTDHGIIVGFTSADTNYQIRTNDGTTSVTTTQMTGPVAKTAATAFHTIEISWTASGNYIVTYDGTAQTISADLPAATADLYANLMVQTSAAVQRTLTLKALYMETDK